MAETANHAPDPDRNVNYIASRPSQQAVVNAASSDCTPNETISCTGDTEARDQCHGVIVDNGIATPGNSKSRKDAGAKHGLIKKLLRRSHANNSGSTSSKTGIKIAEIHSHHRTDKVDTKPQLENPEQKMGNVHQGNPMTDSNSPLNNTTSCHPQPPPSSHQTHPPGTNSLVCGQPHLLNGLPQPTNKVPVSPGGAGTGQPSTTAQLEALVERLRGQLTARDRRIQELERQVDKLSSVLHQQLTDAWVQPKSDSDLSPTGLQAISFSHDSGLASRADVRSSNPAAETGHPDRPEQLAVAYGRPQSPDTPTSPGARLDRTPPAAALLLKKRLGVSGEPMPRCAMELKYFDKNAKSRQQIREALRSNDLLMNLDAVQLQETVSCMHEESFPAGSYIIREGDDGEHLYVGAAGEYEVSKGGKRLCLMTAGRCFGELALLYNCKRTASVKAITDARVWVLDRSSFQTIMRKTGLERLEERKAFLRSVPLFKKLSSSRILRIADALEAQYHASGDCIIRQGELAHSFFIIQSGKVNVTISKAPGQDKTDTVEEVEVRQMSKGEFFGEIALLSECRRTANVYALDPGGVEVLCLYRKDFLELVGDVQELKNRPYFGDDSAGHKTKPSHSTSADPTKQSAVPPTRLKLTDTTTTTSSSLSDDPGTPGSRPGNVSPLLLCQLDNTTTTSTTVQSLLRQSDIKLVDLERICVLGVGGFGRVDLVTLTYDRTQAFALKRMQKQHIVQTRQQEHVHLEKIILASVSSPFICRLYATYRDNKYVYMLMEACLGGELWTLLRDSHHLDDRTAKFCLACCIEALDYLHRHGIIYRDLKPENMLITAQGYIKLCDFGFAKYIGIGQKTWTFCGTPEYVAPEVILNKGHDFAADYWSLGILTFELLTGTPPFQAPEPIRIYMKTLKGIDALGLAQNKFISLKALHFIRRLCRFNPSERMGLGKHGIQEIRNHKYFQGFDWVGVSKQLLATPFKVKLNGPLDASNFDRFTMDEVEPPDEMSGWDAKF